MRGGSLTRLLTDQVTCTSPGGVDQYGQPLSGHQVTVQAKVVHKHTRSRMVSGEEFTSTTQVLTLHPVQLGDTLTVDTLTRPVRAVKRAAGARGGVTVTEAHL